MAHNSCEVFEALCRIICAMLLFLEIGWVVGLRFRVEQGFSRAHL